MTENVPTQGETPEQLTTETGTAPAAQAGAGETPADVQALIDKAVAEATKKANHEAAKYRKQAEQFEAEKRQREEAALSETEKLAKRAAELEAENTRLRMDGLRSQAAAKHGLPAELAERLQGGNLEELLADAEKLAALLPKAPNKPNIGSTAPGGAMTGETEAQRRARIYSVGGNIFSTDFNQKKGGGVQFVEKE